ncbi:hypothetical protein DWUX_1657 [Desulfovibrio diazotrophicus]|nr:hypothetical protein DWUX_1657 [Desulfovibrio diazotrophicus]
MIRMRSLFMFFILLSVIPLNGVCAEQPTNKIKPVVRVQQVIRNNFQHYYDGTGSIEPTKIAVLASPAEGPVVECSTREGDMVGQGDILLRIGRRHSTEAYLSSAAEDLRKEELEVRRVEALVQNGAIPAEQLSTARANLKKAKAQFSKLTENMDDFQIKAPWPAIVGKVFVREGNFMAPRVPLVELYDPSSLALLFTVPEGLAAQVRVGMSIDFQLDAFANQRFSAKISRIYPELDRKTRSLTLEAVPLTVENLRPGMFARLHLLLNDSANALSVPVRTVKEVANGKKAIFIVRGETVIQQPVKIGIEQNELVEILEGLNDGDIVVTDGWEKLKDGAVVQFDKGNANGQQSASGVINSHTETSVK